MNPYIIEKTYKKPYSAIVIGMSSQSPFSYLNEIEQDLINDRIHGKVLIDCLLHNGNTSNRFLEIEFDNGFNMSSARTVSLNRENYFREFSSSKLAAFPEIIKNSILNKNQKDLLLRRVCL